MNCIYKDKHTGQMFKSDLKPLTGLDEVTNLAKISVIVFIFDSVQYVCTLGNLQHLSLKVIIKDHFSLRH